MPKPKCGWPLPITVSIWVACRGLWQAKGAVSPEILPYVQAAGLRWLASDEEIYLARSLNIPVVRDHEKLNTNPAASTSPIACSLTASPAPP